MYVKYYTHCPLNVKGMLNFILGYPSKEIVKFKLTFNLILTLYFILLMFRNWWQILWYTIKIHLRSKSTQFEKMFSVFMYFINFLNFLINFLFIYHYHCYSYPLNGKYFSNLNVWILKVYQNSNNTLVTVAFVICTKNTLLNIYIYNWIFTETF